MFDCSIHPFNDDLYAGRYADNGYSDAEDTHSEDSNSESNWRNEYPDEDEDNDDDDESIGEKDMRRAVNNLDIGMLISALTKLKRLFSICFQATIYPMMIIFLLMTM